MRLCGGARPVQADLQVRGHVLQAETACRSAEAAGRGKWGRAPSSWSASAEGKGGHACRLPGSVLADAGRRLEAALRALPSAGAGRSEGHGARLRRPAEAVPRSEGQHGVLRWRLARALRALPDRQARGSCPQSWQSPPLPLSAAVRPARPCARGAPSFLPQPTACRGLPRCRK